MGAVSFLGSSGKVGGRRIFYFLCIGLTTSILTQASTTLISLLLPEGILDYFELTKVDKDSSGLHIYLEENNSAPVGYNRADL